MLADPGFEAVVGQRICYMIGSIRGTGNDAAHEDEPRARQHRRPEQLSCLVSVSMNKKQTMCTAKSSKLGELIPPMDYRKENLDVLASINRI